MRSRIYIAVLMFLLLAKSAFSATSTPTAAAERASRKAWRTTMLKIPRLPNTCSHVTYPSTTWQETPCITVPLHPFTIGSGGSDVLVTVPIGQISRAVGSFANVTGLTSETGYDYVTSTADVPNIFSLQLNSAYFSTPVCDSQSGCFGWQQFLYSASTSAAFMQYWLLNYTSCPGGWNTSGSNCFKNSAGVAVPSQVITNLPNITLTATAISGGLDTIVMDTGTDLYTAIGSDSVLYLAAAWTSTEFNILGDAGGSGAHGAMFNSGAELTLALALDSGSLLPPMCSSFGLSGESSNLSFAPTPNVSPIGSPSFIFAESTAGGGPTRACASGVAIGHALTPLNGTDTIGGTGTTKTASANVISLQVTPSASGILSTVGINVNTTGSANIIVSIYTDSAGNAGTLLGQSTSTAATTGWNDLAIPGGVSITYGTKYWLAFEASNTSCLWNASSQGPVDEFYYAHAYGSFTSSPSWLGAVNNLAVDMRMTYTPISAAWF